MIDYDVSKENMLPLLQSSLVLSIWAGPTSALPREGIVYRPALQTWTLEKNGGKRNKRSQRAGLRIIRGQKEESEMRQELRKMDGEGKRNVLKWLRSMSVLLVFGKIYIKGRHDDLEMTFHAGLDPLGLSSP